MTVSAPQDTALLATGLNMVPGVTIPRTGANDAAAVSGVMTGGRNTAPRKAIAPTGGAAYAFSKGRFRPMGGGAALLAGGSGCDTPGTAADLGATGGNERVADLDQTGANMLHGAMDNLPVCCLSRDLAVSFILDQIEAFCAHAPAPIGFRTGFAR